MKKHTRHILRAVTACLTSLTAALCAPVAAFGFTTYYSDVSKSFISKGVVYEESRSITDMGLLDVFTLRIPANDPNILLSAAASGEVGLKESVSKLIGDTGAIAGVNGDFFGTAGSYSMATGLQIDVNGALSVSSDINKGKNSYASFMLADDGNYFMDYINVTLRFYNNGAENIQLASINKVADLAGPTCLTADFTDTTADIDARIPEAMKLVVRSGVITYISAKGETVNVPGDGYVILMSGALWDQIRQSFAVGQRAELIMDSSLNLKALVSAISGGGKILINGQVVTDSGHYSKGVHPRTAVGISADGKEIIIMVVDGRTHSVGVTHEELAQLMLEAGAYNAMHLDGGGSTEMVVAKPWDDVLDIVNYPSGGVERKVINALGVYLTVPLGDMKTLVIEPYCDTTIVSSPLRVSVYGLDEYMRRIDIPQELVTLSSTGQSNFFDGQFNAFTVGEYTLTASCAGFTATCIVNATELYELRPGVKEIKTSTGTKTTLTFTGIGKNGNVFDINPLSVGIEVYPHGLGAAQYGVFESRAVGVGWIRCYLGRVNAYVPVYSTIVAQTIDALKGEKPLSFSAYPETLSGTAQYEYFPDYGFSLARLSYNFLQADHTQAAYMDVQGLTGIDSKGFRVSVLGDMSGLWLRARVTDAAGTEHLVDLARVIDWEGWKEVEAWLPQSVVYPVTLKSIYVASLSSDADVSGSIYLSGLRGLYDNTYQYPSVETPASNVFSDPMRVEFYDWTEYGYDITFMPDAAAPAEGKQSYNRAMDVFLYNASAGIYMGAYGASFQEEHYGVLERNKTHLTSYSPAFTSYGAGSLYVIHMTAASPEGKGFMFADKAQWARLNSAINASYSVNVLLITDISPKDFSNKKEAELLHEMLRKYVALGMNIFVLSQGGMAPDVEVVDGVRYITMGSLYQNGALNEYFSVLRFRLNGDDIKYSLECIFD